MLRLSEPPGPGADRAHTRPGFAALRRSPPSSSVPRTPHRHACSPRPPAQPPHAHRDGSSAISPLPGYRASRSPHKTVRSAGCAVAMRLCVPRTPSVAVSAGLRRRWPCPRADPWGGRREGAMHQPPPGTPGSAAAEQARLSLTLGMLTPDRLPTASQPGGRQSGELIGPLPRCGAGGASGQKAADGVGNGRDRRLHGGRRRCRRSPPAR